MKEFSLPLLRHTEQCVDGLFSSYLFFFFFSKAADGKRRNKVVGMHRNPFDKQVSPTSPTAWSLDSSPRSCCSSSMISRNVDARLFQIPQRFSKVSVNESTCLQMLSLFPIDLHIAFVSSSSYLSFFFVSPLTSLTFGLINGKHG